MPPRADFFRLTLKFASRTTYFPQPTLFRRLVFVAISSVPIRSHLFCEGKTSETSIWKASHPSLEEPRTLQWYFVLVKWWQVMWLLVIASLGTHCCYFLVSSVFYGANANNHGAMFALLYDVGLRGQRVRVRVSRKKRRLMSLKGFGHTFSFFAILTTLDY